MKNIGIVLFSSACLLMLSSCAAQNTASRTTPVYSSSTTPGLIPTGTAISVLTSQAIDATTSSVGQTYPAEIENDILDANGRLLVPKGSPAQLVVMNVALGGKIQTGQIQLGLKSITVNGTTYAVETPAVTQSGTQGLGANQRTAAMVGGGALLGAVIGAVAGGGTGAVIGGASGAGAGAAVQVLTKGSQVKVPAETVLTYQLQEPIHLEGYPG